ncbi:histidine phosphatase family protein [Alkalithermobacter thermoalcaliphilus]
MSIHIQMEKVLKQFHERVANCIDQIIKKSDGKTVLICTHSGVIRSIISHLISKTYNYHWNFKIDNCSISMLEIQDDFAVIHTLNNTSHLKAGIKYEGRED